MLFKEHHGNTYTMNNLNGYPGCNIFQMHSVTLKTLTFDYLAFDEPNARTNVDIHSHFGLTQSLIVDNNVDHNVDISV